MICVQCSVISECAMASHYMYYISIENDII